MEKYEAALQGASVSFWRRQVLQSDSETFGVSPILQQNTAAVSSCSSTLFSR